MPTATKEKTAERPTVKSNSGDFDCPVMTHGDMVSYWPRGLTMNNPLPALVILDHDSFNLTLHIWAPDGQSVMQGVKHKDDPDLTDSHKQRAGCWAERIMKK